MVREDAQSLSSEQQQDPHSAHDCIPKPRREKGCGWGRCGWQRQYCKTLVKRGDTECRTPTPLPMVIRGGQQLALPVFCCPGEDRHPRLPAPLGFPGNLLHYFNAPSRIFVLCDAATVLQELYITLLNEEKSVKGWCPDSSWCWPGCQNFATREREMLLFCRREETVKRRELVGLIYWEAKLAVVCRWVQGICWCKIWSPL